MKLSKTTLGIPLAGMLLVVAAGAVMATSAAPPAPAAPVPAAATPTPSPTSGTGVMPAPKDDVLTSVLDDLVAKGTITTAQEKAILDGVTAERTSRREARQQARAQAKADLQQLRDFLSDGVITQDEFDKLPADSALRKLTGLMDDGKITIEELRSLGIGFFGGGRGGHGPFGGGWPGGKGRGAAPSASPTPTSGTSG